MGIYFRDILLISISRGANNCGQHALEKNSYFTMRFSPHFQLFYFNDRLEFCEFFEWKIKRINNADLFSQTPFLTFIKGANISGGHCIYIYLQPTVFTYINALQCWAGPAFTNNLTHTHHTDSHTHRLTHTQDRLSHTHTHTHTHTQDRHTHTHTHTHTQTRTHKTDSHTHTQDRHTHTQDRHTHTHTHTRQTDTHTHTHTHTQTDNTTHTTDTHTHDRHTQDRHTQDRHTQDRHTQDRHTQDRHHRQTHTHTHTHTQDRQTHKTDRHTHKTDRHTHTHDRQTHTHTRQTDTHTHTRQTDTHTQDRQTHTHTHTRQTHTHTHTRQTHTHTHTRQTHTHTQDRHTHTHTQDRHTHTHTRQTHTHTHKTDSHTHTRQTHTHTTQTHTHTTQTHTQTPRYNPGIWELLRWGERSEQHTAAFTATDRLQALIATATTTLPSTISYQSRFLSSPHNGRDVIQGLSSRGRGEQAMEREIRLIGSKHHWDTLKMNIGDVYTLKANTLFIKNNTRCFWVCSWRVDKLWDMKPRHKIVLNQQTALSAIYVHSLSII